MTEWYIIYSGQQIGPITKEQLLSYGLNPQSKVWHEGLPGWVEAFKIPELMDLIRESGASTAPGYGPAAYNGGAYTPGVKDKNTAGILALLLGGIGIQYFYLNKGVAGILCILLSLVSCGLWSIVTFIQGILMLTMTPEQFQQKYVDNPNTFPLF